LNEAATVALLGAPFDSEEDALAAAHRWLGLLQKAFSRVGIGADFGERAPQGFTLTSHGVRWMEETTGERILTDVHGISVFESEPSPRFAGGSVQLTVGKNANELASVIRAAREQRLAMSSRERIAYDLYAASFFESSADAQFAVLMMAIETLIDPGPRPDGARAHVDQLIAQTQTSNLPASEIASIVGSLRYMRDESIGQAGRKLASRLGDRKYLELAPRKFFTDCYSLRSALFHGREPRPDVALVRDRIAPLREFVSDLLTLDLSAA